MTKPKKSIAAQNTNARPPPMQSDRKIYYSIIDVYSIVVQVEKGEALKEDLSVRMEH